MYDITDGKVNIAMGSVLKVWHDYRDAGIASPEKAELPPMSLLEEKSHNCDINKVIIDAEKNEIYISDEKVSLDVGALAKGYAVEKVAQALKELGYEGHFTIEREITGEQQITDIAIAKALLEKTFDELGMN